jgi:hypothetical protein
MPGGSTGAPGGGGSGAPACSPLATVPRRLWRLSVQQYGNAVRDLLGLPQAPTLSNTGGTSAFAFFSDAGLGVDPQLQFSVYETTQALMTAVTPRIPQLAGCTAGEAEDACAQRFAQTFGQKAFRRALDPSELTGLLGVYQTGRQQDFNTGIRLMIEALVQSPSFIYRSELGPTAATSGNVGLTPSEIATQLSFFLTDTIPDQPLLDAAANGSIATADGLAAQVSRLLALDSVKQNITRIVLSWFNVNQLFIKTKDPSFFSALAAADQDQTTLQNDVYTATQRFVDSVLWQGSGKVNDLLTSPQIFVNQRLAQVYGYPFTGQPDQFVAVNPSAGQRAGMLTQPGFLWALSDAATTSIVKRGKFIHDDVICQDPGPGPGAILDDPAVQAKLAMLPTEIDKSNYRLSTQPCQSCHAQIDPYALVLENFDAIGAYRTVADELPVDPTGHFLGASPLAPQSINGAGNFAKALVDDKLLTSCGVQKIASYAIGQMIRQRATCEVQDLSAQFEAADGTISSVFRQVALASFLRVRSGGVQ